MEAIAAHSIQAQHSHQYTLKPFVRGTQDNQVILFCYSDPYPHHLFSKIATLFRLDCHPHQGPTRGVASLYIMYVGVDSF